MRLDDGRTGVFWCKDDMGIGGMNGLYGKGKRCGGDVCIMGFDDIGF